MSVWGQVTWDIARSGGFVGYGLLTLAVALGLALSMQWHAPRWPRLINSELHNFVTLLSFVFIVIHVLAVWLDPFTAFGWSEVFIPFASHYRAVWMAFGIVALYLGLALAASVWLRPYIGYEWWRRLHVLTLAVYLLVTVHGLATGSDTRTIWGAAIYALSGLCVAALLWMRLLVPVGAQQRRHPIWVGITGLALFIGVIATVLGPMRAGWNSVANGNSGSGQRGSSLTAPASQHATPPSATATSTPSATHETHETHETHDGD
jgi:predicted ferric reductase